MYNRNEKTLISFDHLLTLGGNPIKPFYLISSFF